jgi:hypothetical protein
MRICHASRDIVCVRRSSATALSGSVKLGLALGAQFKADALDAHITVADHGQFLGSRRLGTSDSRFAPPGDLSRVCNIIKIKISSRCRNPMEA